MKKLMSMLLVAVMCLTLCSFASAEAELPVEEIAYELDETYVEVPIGENYAYTYVPADWLSIEAEYADETSELLGTFSNAEGTMMLFVTYTESDTPSSYEETVNQIIENGLNAGLLKVNDWLYACLNTVTEDLVTMISTTFLDEECTASISFTLHFPASDIETIENTFYQILGGLHFAE